ncbi:hypothetical protein QJQ45_029591, partial [Haematococcus lacustris]
MLPAGPQMMRWRGNSRGAAQKRLGSTLPSLRSQPFCLKPGFKCYVPVALGRPAPLWQTRAYTVWDPYGFDRQPSISTNPSSRPSSAETSAVGLRHVVLSDDLVAALRASRAPFPRATSVLPGNLLQGLLRVAAARATADDGSAAGDNAVLTLLRFLQSHNVSLDSLASTASAPAAERKGVEGGELAGLEALGRSGLLYVAMWHASVQGSAQVEPDMVLALLLSLPPPCNPLHQALLRRLTDPGAAAADPTQLLLQAQQLVAQVVGECEGASSHFASTLLVPRLHLLPPPAALIAASLPSSHLAAGSSCGTGQGTNPPSH